MKKNKNKFKIYIEDSNVLVRNIKANVDFVDPLYNNRQYNMFYHVLENLTKWEKSKLEGTALKPPAENMSNYCRSSAPVIFDDLIQHLNVKYIVVTYNSKSRSSRNKITLERIKETLGKKVTHVSLISNINFLMQGNQSLIITKNTFL